MTDEKIQELWEQYTGLLRSTNRPNIENLIKWLDESDFKIAPASTQYHNAYKGGLLQHSLNVYYCLFDFKTIIDFMEIPQDTLILTALLHDICKAYCYVETTRNVKDASGNWTTVPYYQFNEWLPWGHGEKSVILILQQGVYLNDIEISMIRNHMGFTEYDDSRRVGKLFRICPQSNLLYYADISATMLFESYDGPQRFIEKIKLGGRNLTECMELLKKNHTIESMGTKYELAPLDAVVDEKKIIEVPFNGTMVKVYAPYGDGLPF